MTERGRTNKISKKNSNASFQIFYFCSFLVGHFSVDWYKGILTDKQLDELENPPTTTTEKAKIKVSRRKHPPRKHQRQQTEEPETVDVE